MTSKTDKEKRDERMALAYINARQKFSITEIPRFTKGHVVGLGHPKGWDCAWRWCDAYMQGKEVNDRLGAQVKRTLDEAKRVGFKI